MLFLSKEKSEAYFGKLVLVINISFQHLISSAYSGGIELSEGYFYTHKHRIKHTLLYYEYDYTWQTSISSILENAYVQNLAK